MVVVRRWHSSSKCGLCYAARMFVLGLAVAIGFFWGSRFLPEPAPKHIVCVEGFEAYADANHQWQDVRTADGERVRCASIENAP